jgi:hypothetical protein
MAIYIHIIFFFNFNLIYIMKSFWKYQRDNQNPLVEKDTDNDQKK